MRIFDNVKLDGEICNVKNGLLYGCFNLHGFAIMDYLAENGFYENNFEESKLMQFCKDKELASAILEDGDSLSCIKDWIDAFDDRVRIVVIGCDDEAVSVDFNFVNAVKNILKEKGWFDLESYEARLAFARKD